MVKLLKIGRDFPASQITPSMLEEAFEELPDPIGVERPASFWDIEFFKDLDISVWPSRIRVEWSDRSIFIVSRIIHIEQ